MAEKEAIYGFYRARLAEGYKLHEIDEMDIYYFMELLSKQDQQQQEELVYIDDIW
jgi:hypothetical protein